MASKGIWDSYTASKCISLVSMNFIMKAYATPDLKSISYSLMMKLGPKDLLMKMFDTDQALENRKIRSE